MYLSRMLYDPHMYYPTAYTYIYIYIYILGAVDAARRPRGRYTPNLPTDIVPTNIVRLKLSGKIPMDMTVPPL